jgi:arylformamidase
MPVYYDISLPIAPTMPTWPSDAPIVVEPTSRIGRGDSANVSRLGMSSHTLTHVDPPGHFIEQGLTIDRLPLDVLIGPAIVVEPHPQKNLITATDLGQLGIRDVERVLIKTRNSDLWMGGPYEFQADYVSLSKDAAAWLVSKRIKLVGVDYLSVEAYEAREHPVHHTLLGNGVVIVEGLNLTQVPEGRYQLICLPLKIQNGDGAPARVVLMR